MNKIVLGLIVAVLVLGVVFPRGNSVVERIVVGAEAGPEKSNRQLFNAGFTAGGYMATTSTAATYALTAGELQQLPTTISWLPNLNTTITISATSTKNYVPKIGDVAELYFRNASSTAGATVTFAAADSGLDLQFAEATGGDLVLNGLDFAKVTIIRTGANLVTVIFDEMTEAD